MIDHALAGTPYGMGLELCLALAVISWVLSLLTREYSWTDRLWSVVPTVMCLIVATDLRFESVRVNVMTVLVVLWSIRLTANFALKGGYRAGGEDYRWAYLKERCGPVRFQLLNLVFTSFGQLAIVWLFTSPIHQAWSHAGQPLRWLDYVAVVLFLGFLVIETTADAQMLRFQRGKKQQLNEGIAVVQPFMREGLYRFSRHPNYVGEMGMWVAFYLLAVSGSDRIWHWTGLGCVILILMFQGSSLLTEKISSGKYPGYSDYQATVPMFIPNPLRLRRS